MPKFNFLKKNAAPTPSDLNPRPTPPAIIWTRIIYSAVIVVLITVPLSALLFWQILNEDPAEESMVNGPALINKERLQEVVEVIQSRSL